MISLTKGPLLYGYNKIPGIDSKIYKFEYILFTADEIISVKWT